MTVQPIEAVDTIAHLDFTPEYACEHPHHGEDDCHDGGAATHWAMSTHICFGPVGIPYPICNRYAYYVRATPNPMGCRWCRQPVGDRWVIGPITTAA